MSPDLDQKLCADFPELFANRFGDMTSTAMCWGFECGAGWEPIIRGMATELTYLSKLSGAKFTASQVKEKFGTLRFYFDTEIPEDMAESDREALWSITSAIEQRAETRSSHTCELCGEPGRTRGGSWLATLCPAHAYKSGYPLRGYEAEALGVTDHITEEA
jgi:hypothetical protein